MATIALADLGGYEGRKIRVTKKPEGEKAAVVVEGTVEVWNPESALLLKIKGKASADLILPFELDKVELDETKETLAASKVKPVKANRVRRHLLNAHGMLLSEVNALTDDDAMVLHEKLHSETPTDLGHVHTNDAPEEKKDKKD